MVSEQFRINIHRSNGFNCSQFFSFSSNNVSYDHHQTFFYQLSSLAKSNSATPKLWKSTWLYWWISAWAPRIHPLRFNQYSQPQTCHLEIRRPAPTYTPSFIPDRRSHGWTSWSRHFSCSMDYTWISFSHRSKIYEICLKDDLQHLKRGSRSVTEYSHSFKALCDQLAAMGSPTDKIHWFLRGLGSEFANFSTI